MAGDERIVGKKFVSYSRIVKNFRDGKMLRIAVLLRSSHSIYQWTNDETFYRMVNDFSVEVVRIG